MRIIVWNCNMAFRRKAELILEYNPDILIIPECENPDALKFPLSVKQPDDIVWHGDNPNKGLGVLSYNGYKLRLLPVHDPTFKTIIPLTVSSGQRSFTMFAVWANNPQDKGNQYVGQVWKAINHYKALLAETKTILIGDFNSNTIWDKPRRKGNHTTVVEYLKKRGIHSTYHHHFTQAQGKEQHPTFYLYRDETKPYHLDYCFCLPRFYR